MHATAPSSTRSEPPRLPRRAVAWRIVKETFFEWFNDGVPRLGASLAFYTIFSAAPIAIIVTWIAGMLFGSQTVERGLLDQVRELAGRGTADFVEALIHSAHHTHSGLTATLLGFAAMFLGATAFFVELQNALNIVWNAPVDVERIVPSLVLKRVLSFFMVVASGFFFMVMLIANAALAAVETYMRGWLPAWPVTLLRDAELAVSFVVSTLLIAAIYKVLPDVRIAWRDVWVGALVTSLLFNLGRYLIGLYLGRESFASGYGAAGAFVVLLLWVYYSAQVMLLGAEFTQVYARAAGRAFTAKRRRYLRLPPEQPIAPPQAPAV